LIPSVKTAILLSVLAQQVNVSSDSDGVARKQSLLSEKYYYCVVKFVPSTRWMSQHVMITSDESMDHVNDFIEQSKKKGVSCILLFVPLP
jgi:hypothetical protein